ncbi:MAG: hypothetical protein WBE80_06815 [Methylocella sp.]
MQQVRLISVFWLIFGLALAPPAPTAGQEDPFITLQTNVPGAFSYVRREEIEALADVSPSQCVLLLSTGKDVRAFEKCASALDELQSNSFISFPAEFGNIYVSPQGVVELVWTGNSRCHLTLESRESVDAKESCNDVHKALPRE